MITFTPLSVPYGPAPTNDTIKTVDAKGKSKATVTVEDDAGGVAAEEQEVTQAMAYLLELDDITILIDCGGTEDFSFPYDPSASSSSISGAQSDTSMETDKDGGQDKENEKAASPPPSPTLASSEWNGRPAKEYLRSGSLDSILSKVGPSIDLVLLTHSTLAHLGSLAWVRSHYKLDCPIFATLPTQTMGRLTVLEAVHCLRNSVDIDLEMRLAAEIDNAHSMQSKDQESAPQSIKESAATSVPDNAGRMLVPGQGGAGSGEAEDADETAARAMAEKAIQTHLDPSNSKIEALRESIKNSSKRRRVPSIEQVEQTFEAISTLRYLQPYHFSLGRLAGITLTAYNAGHTLGGTVWKLRSPSQGTILIALEWNHNRERHLDGTALLSSAASGGGAGSAAGSGPGSSASSTYDAVRRADLMITSIQRGRITNIRRKDRDAAILDIVHQNLQANHSVLFPVDPSARLLELLVLLDQHWAYAYPHARFPLCLVSQTGSEVLERARTLMEWMTREWATAAAGSAAQAAEAQEAEEDTRDTRGNYARRNNNRRARDRMQKEGPASPLDFKYLRIFSSLDALNREIPAEHARVVLAVQPSLTAGPARDLVAAFAQRPDDVILLTQRGEPGSLTRWLFDEWEKRQAPAAKFGKGKVGTLVKPGQGGGAGEAAETIGPLEVELCNKVTLSDEELKLYEDALQAAKEKAAQRRALLARSRRRLEADEEDEDDDDDDSDADDGDDFGEFAGGVDGAGATMSLKRGFSSAFQDEIGGQAGAQDTTQVSFDIYLRGSASRVTSFFGNKVDDAPGNDASGGAGVRFRMFPFAEKRRRIDAYGEAIDVSRWLANKQQIEEAGQKEEDGLEVNAAQRARIQAQKAKYASPSKYVVEKVQLQLQCGLAYIEMDGLNDGRALKTLLPQLHPRRLIMVNGDFATRQEMKQSLNSVKAMTKELWAPSVGLSVSIGESTAAVTVNLGDKLVTGLRLSQFEDFEVAFLRSCYKITDQSSLATLDTADDQTPVAKVEKVEEEQPREEGEGDAEDGEVVAKSQEPVSVAQKTILPTIFIGDLKLSRLKANLAGSRIPADFAGEGLLVCGLKPGTNSTEQASAITVQKQGEGKIVVEGNIGSSFYDVRNRIYGLHAHINA